MYPVTKNYIVRNRPYQKLVPLGMVVHETADPGATDQGEREYFNNNNLNASAHTFIDWDSITELIPSNRDASEVAWHAGYTANHRFIGVELCRPKTHDEAKFKEVWDRGVWYFASKMINVCNINTITKDNLMSHKEVSDKWKESDHQDPVAYFAEYGRTVNQFRQAVQDEMSRMLGRPKVTAPDPVYKVVVPDVLNVRNGAGTLYQKIGVLKKGDKVRVSYIGASWTMIYYGAYGGWVASQYIK